MIAIAMVIMLNPFWELGASEKFVQAAESDAQTYSRTYTQMKDYDYGEKNGGFYMVPMMAVILGILLAERYSALYII